MSTRSIWILKQYAITPDLSGNTRHYELGQKLFKKGYNVTIIATSFSNHYHQDMKLEEGELWKNEIVDNVNFIWIRTFPFAKNNWRRIVHFFSYMIRSYRLGRKLPLTEKNVTKPDLVIGCSVPPSAALSGYWLAKHFNSRFFFEVGDLWPESLIDMDVLTGTNPVAEALRFLENFLYRHAEKIITPLPNASSYIQKQGIPEKKIVWLPNGINIKSYNSRHESLKNDSDFTVVYAGAHGYSQALETITRAAKKIQERGNTDIKFKLVGDGPEKSNLQKMANKLNLTNIEFFDPMPKQDIPNMLESASVTVFSLRNSPIFRKFGISSKKLFDYLAAGSPVVFACSAANNPVHEAKAGITVPPEDPEALAEAILKLYKLPKKEREAMGKRGRRYVEKNYNWSALSNKLLNCIQEKI